MLATLSRPGTCSLMTSIILPKTRVGSSSDLTDRPLQSHCELDLGQRSGHLRYRFLGQRASYFPSHALLTEISHTRFSSLLSALGTGDSPIERLDSVVSIPNDTVVKFQSLVTTM